MEENINNSEQQLTETAATAEVNNSVQEVEKPKTENAPSDKTFSQADVDKMISARLERERKKFEAEKEEAAKLAKMNAEQKKAYEDKKREEELTARETAIKEKELRYTALNILEENKLPTKLVECLNLTSAEACNKSIEAIKTAWAEALTAAVDARLKSKQPPAYSGGNEETDPFLEGLGL